MANHVKKHVKRTKTYTGCWTCRSRGVKCDLTRPACSRCTRSKRTCQGYGIRLVWIGQEPEPNKVTERRLVDASFQQNPVFEEEHLETAIEDLDAFGNLDDLQIQPYTVFRAFEISQDVDPISCNSHNASADDVSSLCVGDKVSWTALSETERVRLQLDDNPTPSAESASASSETTGEDIGRAGESTACLKNLKVRLLPLLQSFLSEATMYERKLLHHWVTSMSGMMVPTTSPDNPYKILYIPFALEAANSSSGFSGNSALLHAIYTVSAKNLAQLSDDQSHSLAGVQHQQLSLQRLQDSLQESQLCTDTRQLYQQREVILAAILLLSTVDIISGTSSTWRIHLREGKRYVKSIIDQSMMTRSVSTLYQLFLCLDMIGSENCIDRCPISSDEYQQLSLFDAFDDSTPDSEYCLDRIFGLTKPVAEVIYTTNRLMQRGCHPSEEELSALESQLVLANPSIDMVGLEDTLTARMLRHHRCAFYLAAVIHCRKSLFRTPASEVQHLVEDSLYHLQTIDVIEANLNVNGLFWPVFVTACEADNESFRDIALKLFSKGERCGIGNIKKALLVVQEVWARRDSGCSEADASRHEVMKQVGLDLLLA